MRAKSAPREPSAPKKNEAMQASRGASHTRTSKSSDPLASSVELRGWKRTCGARRREARARDGRLRAPARGAPPRACAGGRSACPRRCPCACRRASPCGRRCARGATARKQSNVRCRQRFALAVPRRRGPRTAWTPAPSRPGCTLRRWWTAAAAAACNRRSCSAAASPPRESGTGPPQRRQARTLPQPGARRCIAAQRQARAQQAARQRHAASGAAQPCDARAARRAAHGARSGRAETPRGAHAPIRPWRARNGLRRCPRRASLVATVCVSSFVRGEQMTRSTCAAVCETASLHRSEPRPAPGLRSSHRVRHRRRREWLAREGGGLCGARQGRPGAAAFTRDSSSGARGSCVERRRR